jgi:uncharacterized protein (TIGR02266 family)
MRLSCPFCPEKIKPETTVCPSCRNVYDIDTLKFLRILARESAKENVHERREDLRVPTKLKVSYSSPIEFVDNYLHNLSLGGLFIETGDPLRVGEKTNLKLFLPDNEKRLEVTGEVAWTRKEEVTPEGTQLAGMGIKFLNLSKKARERIIGVLSKALHEIQSQSQPAVSAEGTYDAFVCC